MDYGSLFAVLAFFGILSVFQTYFLLHIKNSLARKDQQSASASRELDLNAMDVIVARIFADHLVLYENPKDYTHIGKLVNYGRGITYSQISSKEVIARHWDSIRKYESNTASALIKMSGDMLCFMELNGFSFNTVTSALAASLTNIVKPNSVIDDVIQERQVSKDEMQQLLEENAWLVFLYFISRSAGVYKFFTQYPTLTEAIPDDETTTNAVNG